MRTYLIAEDDPTKKSNYMKFGKHYGVRFIPVASPRAAITVLQKPGDYPRIDGVIADFELGGQRRDNWRHVRVDVPGLDGHTYPISTGLGVLDWAHSLDPGIALWALTDLSAAHAPLYMSSASLWLDAKPLSIERLYQADMPLGDEMFEELQDPAQYKTLNPQWKWIDEARAAFNELMQTPYSGHEAFDWLNALTHLRAHGGFIPALTNQIRQVTLNPRVNAFANTLAPCMAKWQLRLAEIYQDFSVDREEHRWPRIDEDDPPRSINVWDEFNPITDFLGANSQCREFFEAADVRVALTKWRDRGEIVR
jgi:hypothetical protein